MTPKQNAIQTIGGLPEDASYGDFMDELAVLTALDEAEEDIKSGRLVSHEEVKKQFAQWISH